VLVPFVGVHGDSWWLRAAADLVVRNALVAEQKTPPPRMWLAIAAASGGHALLRELQERGWHSAELLRDPDVLRFLLHMERRPDPDWITFGLRDPRRRAVALDWLTSNQDWARQVDHSTAGNLADGLGSFCDEPSAQRIEKLLASVR